MAKLLLLSAGIVWLAGHAPAQSSAPKAAPEPPSPAPAAQRRSDLNLLGRTNSQAGESRRNENVQFNLIDNNAIKELRVRLGTTATIVSEFLPQRNYFGSEYGTSPAPLLHVGASKPAADFHGLLFATHSNSVFSARSFFQVGGVKPARENQYGINLAGGLWKNAFLTLDGSQHKVRGQVNGNVLAPRPDERTPLVTEPQARDLISRFLAAYPAELPNRPDIDPRALNTNAAQHINTDAATLRFDQIVSGRDRVTARHNWTSQSVDAFQFVAGQNPDTATRSHAARLTWQRIWSAHTTSDVSAGFDRVRSQLMPEPNAVGPQVNIGTAFTTLGPSSSVPLDRVQNRFRHAALLQHQRGSHRLVAGGELTRLRFNGREASSNRGNYYFRNDFGRDAITNFRMGVPNRYSTGIGELDRGFRNWEQHFFAGDTWQARSNLTITIGARYQPFPSPHEVNARTAFDFSCDCNNVAGMVSLAYRLPPSWGVLRASYGLHYGEIFPVTLQQLRWNPPEFQKIEAQAPDLLDPLRNSVIDPNGRSTYYLVPRDLRTPYSHQYNMSWEAALSPRLRLQLGYTGSRSHKLLMLWHMNRAVPAADPQKQITATVNDRRPDKRYFDIRQAANAGRAYFDAGRVTLAATEWKGITLDASYWFSKAIDTGTSYLNMAAGDEVRQGYGQNQNGIQQDLKGPSTFDQSHAALIRVRYQLPAWSSSPLLARGVLGKWAASAVWLAKTGMPFSVISGSDGPGFGNVDGINGDRPHLVDPSVLGRGIGHPDTSEALLPRSAFRFIQPLEPRGNLGSNTFRRGGIRNLNASLSREWNVAGDRKLIVRAESINLTNTPQFAEPNSDLTSPAFGRITNTLNDGRTFLFTAQIRF